MFDRLTIAQVEQLVDQGLYPFGHCRDCAATQPVRPLDTSVGLVAVCCVCGETIANAQLEFMDQNAAWTRLGWRIAQDTPAPLLN